MEFATLLFTLVGFSLAAYAVIANDSVQTLGTFIGSTGKKIKWWKLGAIASAFLLFTIWNSWIKYDGDISYGRLTKIEYVAPTLLHTLAPLALLVITYFGVPVSTSFLVLSAFASNVVLEAMLLKSVMGYGVAALSSYLVWFILAKYVVDERKDVPSKHEFKWGIAQFFTTGFLWYTWLIHDLANIAVFLPRSLSLSWMLFISCIFVVFMFYIFWQKGGKIQNILLQKTSSSYIRSATIIDLVYASVLWYFAGINNIPMSTTWVFVGLLAGRELALSTIHKTKEIKNVFPIIGKDFLKLLVGLAVSIGIVFIIR